MRSHHQHIITTRFPGDCNHSIPYDHHSVPTITHFFPKQLLLLRGVVHFSVTSPVIRCRYVRYESLYLNCSTRGTPRGVATSARYTSIHMPVRPIAWLLLLVLVDLRRRRRRLARNGSVNTERIIVGSARQPSQAARQTTTRTV